MTPSIRNLIARTARALKQQADALRQHDNASDEDIIATSYSTGMLIALLVIRQRPELHPFLLQALWPPTIPTDPQDWELIAAEWAAALAHTPDAPTLIIPPAKNDPNLN